MQLWHTITTEKNLPLSDLQIWVIYHDFFSEIVGLSLRDHWQAFTVRSWKGWKAACVQEHPDSPALFMWIH